jgi:DNA invertase Pin-like site-specific DNA recombinase
MQMNTDSVKLVAYFRVSTKIQGASGLGLEGQDLAVERYRQSVNGTIVREFTEVETGTKKRHRPVMQEALAYCKRTGARLVIAKIDRLARNVHFVSGLMESGTDFVACDNPNATPLMIHILAAFAEHEAREISKRTRDALEAYKVNGRVSRRIQSLYPGGVPEDVLEATRGRLGASLPQCRNLTDEARRKGAEAAGAATLARAVEIYRDLMPRIAAWRSEGLSLRAIAGQLNDAGETTRNGCTWSAKQVQRVLDRVG